MTAAREGRGLSAALSRLGGVFLHPRSTLWRVLARGEGSLFEVLPWLALAALTVSPTGAGQAFLLLRVSPGEGVIALLGLIVNRMSGVLMVMIGGAVLLLVIASAARARIKPGFDRCLDACAYLLLPHLLLASTGAALSELGVELWFLPHRLPKGAPSVLALRLAVAYGWSLLLFGLLAWEIVKRREEETP